MTSTETPLRAVVGLGWIFGTVALTESIRFLTPIEALWLDSVWLYVIVFAALPTVVVGAFSYVYTAIFPSLDGVAYLGGLGYLLSAAAASPAIKTKEKYVEWRRPPKPDDETKVAELEQPVNWFTVEFEGGSKSTVWAYKLTRGSHRFNFWSATGHREYDPKDIFKPIVNSNGDIEIHVADPTWGYDTSNIADLKSGYKRTDLVAATCEVTYKYDYWRNEWVPTIAGYDLETEEDIENGGESE